MNKVERKQIVDTVERCFIYQLGVMTLSIVFMLSLIFSGKPDPALSAVKLYFILLCVILITGNMAVWISKIPEWYRNIKQNWIDNGSEV